MKDDQSNDILLEEPKYQKLSTEKHASRFEKAEKEPQFT